MQFAELFLSLDCQSFCSVSSNPFHSREYLPSPFSPAHLDHPQACAIPGPVRGLRFLSEGMSIHRSHVSQRELWKLITSEDQVMLWVWGEGIRMKARYSPYGLSVSCKFFGSGTVIEMLHNVFPDSTFTWTCDLLITLTQDSVVPLSHRSLMGTMWSCMASKWLLVAASYVWGAVLAATFLKESAPWACLWCNQFCKLKQGMGGSLPIDAFGVV